MTGVIGKPSYLRLTVYMFLSPPFLLSFQYILKGQRLNVVTLRQCSLDTSVRLIGAGEVDISWNYFERLTPGTFLDYSSVISKLTMNNNRLRRIDRLANMTSLKLLDLSENVITNLPDGVFNETLGIFKLYLSHNRLHSIQGIQVLKNLRTLDLRFNRIQIIETHVFVNLDKLKTLILDHNFIHSLDGMPDDLLLVSLTCLSNSITEFDLYQPVVKQVSYVINLHGNPLQQINVSKINAVDLNFVDCKIHTIIALNKLEHVRYILLSENYIRHITEDVMFDLPNLYFVDLGFNFIEHFPKMYLPSLAFLKLDNNRIRNITEGYLRPLSNLRALSIAYNLISFLPNELSHGNLKKIYLQGNKISCVPSHLANNFPELDFIYLSDNRIVSLADITGALAVRSIFLDNNQIETVRGSDLQVQHNSPALHLQNNLISDLNFSAPANIRAVYLENNRVEKVLIGALNSQIMLINLSDNKLSSLFFVNQFQHLVTLKLRGNMITSVTKDTFRTTLELQELDLSNNEIGFLESQAFSRLAYLFIVDLSNNRLNVLEDSTFPHESLLILSLSMNRLSNVSPNIFTGNPSKLQIFYLSDNTIVGSLYAGIKHIQKYFYPRLEELFQKFPRGIVMYDMSEGH